MMFAAILVGQTLGTAVYSNVGGTNQRQSVSPLYRIQANLPSHDQISSSYSGKSVKESGQLMESSTKFYTNLVASQEPLGVEFERVLNENLWSLYER